MVRKAPKQRRQELIKAAGKVFMEKGYAATTVSAITREAGTSHGTFYVYFDGKESVFDAVAQYHVMQVFKTVNMIVDTSDKPALEKIKDLLRVSSEPGLTGWLAQEFNKPHLLHMRARFVQKAMEMFLPLMVRVIREAVQEGLIDVPFPEATALFLIAAGLQRISLEGTESLNNEDWMRAFEDFARRVLGLKD